MPQIHKIIVMKKTINILIIIFACLFGVFFFVGLYFHVNYPILYKEEINKYSQEQGVDKALIFAIAKTESGFNENAKSSAGAVGIMQIKPETANFVCSFSGEVFDEQKLFDSDYNIKLGTAYFKYLLNKFGDTETALAAYNAGEGNVLKWLQNESYSDDGKTLKNIPFAETREYAQKVLKNYKVYKILAK